MKVCPVCTSPDSEPCDEFPTNSGTVGCYCQACGRFELSGSVHSQIQANGTLKLSSARRASLSRKIQLHQRASGSNILRILTFDVSERDDENALLVDPITALERIIFDVGENELSGGTGYILDWSIRALVGARDLRSLIQIAEMGEKAGLVLISRQEPQRIRSGKWTPNISLSYEGWERFYEISRKNPGGKNGFLAMKFNDPALETLVSNTLKPKLSEVGFTLVDVRDVSRAGVIDNIMRREITRSAFVLADLSHDNSGAYWEAGFAEGLGKPVIYICEKKKFEQSKTHFDTNHCTTVMWETDDGDGFFEQLFATLTRSLAQ